MRRGFWVHVCPRSRKTANRRLFGGRPHLDFDVSKAAHYEDFIGAFALSLEDRQTFDAMGFVVLPSPARRSAPYSEFESNGSGPADVYYRVFAEDLPVIITADSILHAWHRSFDKILETEEERSLSPALGALLEKTLGALDENTQAGRDASFYLSVARRLLDPEWSPPPGVSDEVERFIGYIESRALREVDFLGELTVIDFSQFVPRGHYTHSELLERYFMSMMWLGRTDLVLFDSNPGATPRPREEAAARAVVAAMNDSSSFDEFGAIDGFYGIFVGRTNALTPAALLELCRQSGLEGCRGEPQGMVAAYKEQPAPSYSSRVFADPPPISMRFIPQRFAFDAWVTARTTIPRLKPAIPGGRSMAMPEDVAFALGSNRALRYLEEDMGLPHRENLPATLEAARRTLDAVPPTSLDDSIYNSWLEGLMALSKPNLDPALPQVLRTSFWHDKKLESVLASWTEMRHDTILIVEQSTGGIGCQYPQGYVEPVPDVYGHIAQAAERMAAAFKNGASRETLPAFLEHWKTVMSKLKDLSEKELAGEPMNDEDLDFLNKTADLHGESYYGDRIYDGWYPQLYWHRGWQPRTGDEEVDSFEASPSAASEPLVADVHTDADANLALEVATGHPGILIIAIDSGDDIAVYGGPVSSYYAFHQPLSERLTDDQWMERLNSGRAPERPEFSRGYWSE